jgi:hypothetical protein
MTDEWWIWKELRGNFCRNLVEVLTRYLTGGSEEGQEQSVRIRGVPAEIQTEYLQNRIYNFTAIPTSELYCY